MGVFDSPLSQSSEQNKSENLSDSIQTNTYEFGGFATEFAIDQAAKAFNQKLDAVDSQSPDYSLIARVNAKTVPVEYDGFGAVINADKLEVMEDSLIALTERKEQEQTADNKPETLAEMAPRLLLSTGAGCLTDLGLTLAGLRNIPKIGTPLALAVPFVVSGLTSSYLKTNTLTDVKSFTEGALVYGGVNGIRQIGNAIVARAVHSGAEYSVLSKGIPIELGSDVLKVAPRQFTPVIRTAMESTVPRIFH